MELKSNVVGRKSRYLLFGSLLAVGVTVATACAPAAAPSGSSPGQAAAPAFPTKAIEISVPFAAGGTSDLVARILGPQLTKKWNQPVNVVNKGGGSGTPGTVSVLQAPPDGHSVGILANSNGVLNDAVQKDLPYHWNDVGHIARIGVTGLVFVVKADAPYTTLKDLGDAIKKDPAKFKYGSSGVSGPSTFAIGQFAEAIGVDPNKLSRVPYDGGAPAATATAGGHVDFVAQNLPEVLELVRGKQLKALAITGDKRAPELSDVPTTAEAGFKSVDHMGLFGIFGPQKLPESVVKKWEDTLAELMKDEAVVKDLEKIGLIPGYQNSKDFRAFAESQHKAALAIAEKLGLRK